jgi:hypothetical protein
MSRATAEHVDRVPAVVAMADASNFELLITGKRLKRWVTSRHVLGVHPPGSRLRLG